MQAKYEKLRTECYLIQESLRRSDPTDEALTKRAFEWIGSALQFANAVIARCPENADERRFAVMTRRHILGLAMTLETGGWAFPRELYLSVVTLPDHFQFKIGNHRYEFTADLFTQHIEKWKHDLKELFSKDDNSILEIGTYEGFSACWIAEHLLNGAYSALTCVDPFDGPYYELFEKNVRRTGKADRVRANRGRSVDVLPRLKAESYNFIYVDGEHSEDTALFDGREAWRLLSPGGILIFDDYELYDKQERTPVRDAIENLLLEIKAGATVLRRDDQAVIKKR